MLRKNEPPSSLIQISEPHVPKNPKPTRSGFPHSPAKRKPIGIQGPVWREVLLYFQWSRHNQVRSFFWVWAGMLCTSTMQLHEVITNERQHLGTGTWWFFLAWQFPKVVVVFSDELLISINLDWYLKAGDKWEWRVLLWAFQQINGQSWLKDGSTFSECNQVRCNPYCVAH